MKAFVFFALILLSYVYGDCYMQNPRGSNDRLNENNGNRNNANRLFDSQNNAAGGYCVGPPLTFYEGSQLTIEWTTQHGCGNPKLNCNVVLQYMCSRTTDDAGTPLPGEQVIRDGSTTNTVPFNNGNNAGTAAGLAANIAAAHVAQTTFVDEGADDPRSVDDFTTFGFEYGVHENVEYYTGCTTRDRNQGLFAADRIINNNLPQGGDARRTRQNNNGNRNGLECPEERDYYPYWHPSPWKDIGVISDNRDNCGLFRSQSQNVRSKNVCLTADGLPSQYNNEVECSSMGDNWVTVDSHGLPPPACVSSPFNRDNHLGNGITGFANTFNWTLPTARDEDCIDADDCNCVLRIRYNISGGEFEGYGNNAVDISDSNLNSPINGDPYILLENGAYVRLAIDTSQFGRTFQDRSHVFHIHSRDGVSGNRLYNLNVRGKRGNIVQTYPATEYDFVPNYLSVRQGDMIHFQWTGCDFNPAGNAGEGTARTDRSNIMMLENNRLSTNLPMGPGSEETGFFTVSGSGPSFLSDEQALRFATIGQPIDDPTLCIVGEEALEAATNNNEEADPRNCALLNGAPTPYFDGGVLEMSTTGTFNYMSTRNNNFTNRGQKASIEVSPLFPVWAIVLLVLGGVSCIGAAVAFGVIVVMKATGAYGGSVIATANNLI
eukprot:TRINITY_DN2042_c0_g2_i1.p1 TRINITY_DN2042_c0_g2~~TRINITY_DN2042_c0_g2_i1.p1  ORF type:complete len:660 (-),score=92.78 TRINITY_DN2042_c0_g2_i1:11-1990(-)